MNWKNCFFCITNLKFAFFYQSFYHSKPYSVNKWDMQQHHTTPALLNVWVQNKSALQFCCINAPNMNWINRKMSGRHLKKLTEAIDCSFLDFFSKKYCRQVFRSLRPTQRSSSWSADRRNCSGQRAGSGGVIFPVYCILYKELFLGFFGVWPAPIAPLEWIIGPWKKTASKSAVV